MNENKALLEQDNMKIFLQLLEENGMKEQKQEVEFLAGYVDQMESQFSMVLNELKNVRQELSTIQDKTLRASATRAIDKIVTKVEEGKSYIVKLKNHIKQTVDKAVNNFKEQGKSALVSAMNTLHVKGLLETIKGGLSQATQMADKGIDNLTKLGNEIHAVNSHLRNVGRVIIGKELNEVKPRNANKGILSMAQESLFSSMNVFTKMAEKTDIALSRVQSFGTYTKTSVKKDLTDLKKAQNPQQTKHKSGKETELGQR